MKGKKRTIALIVFFGVTASISFYQRDWYSAVILTIPFVYYVVKFLRKYR